MSIAPLDVLGAGLGVWNESDTVGTCASAVPRSIWLALTAPWFAGNVKPESAKQRICLLMNRSVQELDMFILSQGVPGRSFPEPFWIPQLQKFTAGGGCEIVVPAAPVCPNASVGPSNSWVYGEGEHDRL